MPLDVIEGNPTLNLPWHRFENHAIAIIAAQNPAGGLQIQFHQGTVVVEWQGIIPHHPHYDWRASAMIDGNESWLCFSEAVSDAARHGQDLQLWCMARQPGNIGPAPLIQTNQPIRMPSPKITFLIPFHPDSEPAVDGARNLSPDIWFVIAGRGTPPAAIAAVMNSVPATIDPPPAVVDPAPASLALAPAVVPPVPNPAPAAIQPRLAVIEPLPDAIQPHIAANPIDPLLDAHAHIGLASNEEANRITMEEYLTLACIGAGNLDTRDLIELHKISHWSYFRLSTEEQLRNLGFDAGPARLLCLGVPRALFGAGAVDQ
ncbi:hypothetical protein PCASD_06318 [Puccinia coronata f. sp. avenae]|uniref:Uncharacterized protein n=1 Tax=Puccinia coronata f. sp. avenae TaxID=200324 RepID=A0A2N5V916_9BASI|nr:hypothetical protein PCASD_06318 [Puccinia coronata f. sp. avenae]